MKLTVPKLAFRRWITVHPPPSVSMSSDVVDSTADATSDLEESSSSSVPSIIDRLRAPRLSTLTQLVENNKTVLPTWAECVKMVVCIQPSSAAGERVFSLLQSTFGDRQGLALQDYIKTSLMCQYNKN